MKIQSFCCLIKILSQRIRRKEYTWPILVYHRVNNIDRDMYTVRTDKFEQQMRYLFKKGYHTVSLNELKDSLVNKGKKFVITFDDGFEDFLLNALPILKKFNFGATVFITTGLVGRENLWDKKYGFRLSKLMDWEQIQTIAKKGIEIGSHTVSHQDLTRSPDEIVDYELKESKQTLEGMIGGSVNFLSCPFGKYDERVEKIAIKNNYRGLLTTTIGNVNNSKFVMGRTYVVNNDSGLKIFLKLQLLNFLNAFQEVL